MTAPMWVSRSLLQRTVRRCAPWVVIAIATGSCIDDSPLEPRGTDVRLGIVAQIIGVEGHSVEVVVAYLRNDEQGELDPQELFRETFAIDIGTTSFPITLDLAPCLDDPAAWERFSEHSCVLTVELILRDESGTIIDRTTTEEIVGQPGTTAETPAVVLAPSRIEVISGGEQIGYVDRPLLLPVRIRAAKGGEPIPGAIVTITPLAGGGASTPQNFTTDDAGLATIPYRLGPARGENRFRVSFTDRDGASTEIEALALDVPRPTIAAGTFHTCELRPPEGLLWCWGSNVHGTLANPDVVSDTSLPVLAVDAPAFVSITAGAANNVTVDAACALTPIGEAYCWGLNHEGRLGIASSDQCTPPQSQSVIDCAKLPQPVTGGHRFLSIEAGGSTRPFGTRACAVTEAGQAYCWGEGQDGQLGTGTAATQSAPTPVAGEHRFVKITLGDTYTCGLGATGEILCWGDNAFGQLGIGSTTSSLVPVRVSSDERFVELDAGSGFACALTDDGSAYCWGRSFSQGLDGADVLSPRRVEGAPAFETLSVGLSHACGLTTAQLAYCWGSSGRSLGAGWFSGSSPTPVPVVGGRAFGELSAGFHTCARTVPGVLYCWGVNGFGALGIGEVSADAAVPARVNIDGTPTGAAHRIGSTTPSTTGLASAGSLSSSGPAGGLTGVHVTDENGMPVAGVTVNFVVVGGGGSVFPTTFATNANGFASAQWRLGPQPGRNTLHAIADGLEGSPVIFEADGVQPGPAASIEFAGPRSWNFPAGSTFGSSTWARVRDAAGYVVAGHPVTFTSTSSAGSASPPFPAVVTTDVDGLATLASVTLDTRTGIDTIFASADGLTGSPVQFWITKGPAQPFAPVFVQQPANGAANVVLSPPVRVAIQDLYGNLVTASTATVTLTLEGGAGGTLGGTTSVAAVGGVATFGDLTVSAPGSGYVLRAAVAGLADASSTSFAISP